MKQDGQQAWPDLAGRALGGSVIYANDELFAERENLIKPEDPVFQPHTFGHKGQIMDGWETRRRREPGVRQTHARGADGAGRTVPPPVARTATGRPAAGGRSAVGRGGPAGEEQAGLDSLPPAARELFRLFLSIERQLISVSRKPSRELIMAITFGDNQYGKAEVRLVHITRDGDRHQIRDLNVSTALRGDFADAHLVGDNAKVVATDTQKNTVYAFGKQYGVGEIEDFALRLGRHFVDDFEWVTGAKVSVEEYGWDRITVDGADHGHAFSRAGGGTRTTVVTIDGAQAWVVSGLTDLVVLKSTGSEFHGFPRDRYTTLAETTDRILATAVTARWRYAGTDVDWAKSYADVRRILLESFAVKHSLALQQTLYYMGEQVLEAHPEVAEIRMSMPNKHHFLVDLSPFGLANDNEVYYAADRPYGLIEGTVTRDDAPDPGRAWQAVPGF